MILVTGSLIASLAFAWLFAAQTEGPTDAVRRLFQRIDVTVPLRPKEE